MKIYRGVTLLFFWNCLINPMDLGMYNDSYIAELVNRHWREPVSIETLDVVRPEKINLFLQGPEEFIGSFSADERDSIATHVKKADDLMGWVCQYYLNGYEKGVTYKQMQETDFEKLLFLLAVYKQAAWYRPIDIRGNDKLTDIYDGLVLEIKNFIHYYVVTPTSDQKMTIPGLIHKIRNLCCFKIGFSSKRKSD